MTWVNRTIIVPSAFVGLARALTATIAGTSGSNMFIRELAATKAGPATHYISSGSIQSEFAAMLVNPQAIAAASNGQVSLATAQALVASSTVQDSDAESVDNTIARVGLVFVEKPTI